MSVLACEALGWITMDTSDGEVTGRTRALVEAAVALLDEVYAVARVAGLHEAIHLRLDDLLQRVATDEAPAAVTRWGDVPVRPCLHHLVARCTGHASEGGPMATTRARAEVRADDDGYRFVVVVLDEIRSAPSSDAYPTEEAAWAAASRLGLSVPAGEAGAP